MSGNKTSKSATNASSAKQQELVIDSDVWSRKILYMSMLRNEEKKHQIEAATKGVRTVESAALGEEQNPASLGDRIRTGQNG